MIAGDLLAALAPVIEALERRGVRYHLGGSLASSAHGIARASLDVDIVADLGEADVRPLIADLSDDFYADEAAAHRAVRSRENFSVVHLATMFKIDIFVVKDGAFDRIELERARAETIGPPGGRTYIVKAPEDLVLRKLLWYREGGERSERQWRDVVGVLRVQSGQLDREHLARWGQTLGLTDLLGQSLDEAEQ